MNARIAGHKFLLLAALLALSAAVPAAAVAEERGAEDALLDRVLEQLGERYEPIVLIRTLFLHTFEDAYEKTSDSGVPLKLDSKRMDPSPFGHRAGFVLETVEFGLKGTFRASNTYYKLKMALVPREKDGNRSTDFLKDAYFGWKPLGSVLDLRIGRMKLPYSQANMRGTGDQWLVQKPVLNILSQKRQLGALLGAQDPWGVLLLRGGVFNSVKLAVEQMKDADQLLYSGRVDLRLHKLAAALGSDLPWFELNFGANVAWTKENFDPPTEHRWTGFDARLRLWGVEVEGEYLIKDFFQEALPDGSQAADGGSGWHVDLQVDMAMAHAMLEGLSLIGRFEEMDGDDLERGAGSTLSIDELSKQHKRWITAGIRYAVTERFRVDLNYIHRKELEGFSFGNDVVLAMFQYDL